MRGYANRLAGSVAAGALTAVVMLMTVGAAGAGEPELAAARRQAMALQQAGNFKDAYEKYAKLALDPTDTPDQVGEDLRNGLQCLNNLGRQEELDELREKVAATHAKNWRLLLSAARSLADINHYGSLVAGKFVRGPHRGGTAKLANAMERDRVRALQLMDQARLLVEADTLAKDGRYGEFYYELTHQLMGNRGWSEAWRLQLLTDLTTLPDYDEGYNYNNGGSRGAPVNPDGSPLFYAAPKSWQEAKSDGERYRWAVEHGPAGTKYEFAQFLQQQFGVQSMAEYGWFFNRGATADDDTRKDESGTWELHTLKADETIAKLATGIKRFSMPPDFDFIRRFQIMSENRDGQGENALGCLAQEFENRRQYDTAVTYWRRSLEQFGDHGGNGKRQRLDQILKNWGTFEPVMTQPADGTGATVEFRFRNGAKAHFEATEINVPKLLADVRNYIKTKPKQLDWQQLDIANLGWRLVEKNQTQYLGAKAGAWDLELKPRPNHWDRRVTVKTPLKKAGAYLLTGQMANGNLSRIIVWVADTAIVKKPVEKAPYYFVADAVTGKPVANAKLDFFGYRQEWNNNHMVVQVSEKIAAADASGQYFQAVPDSDRNYQWIITATTPEGRFAYLGFTNVWWGNYYDADYNQPKVYTITDRPVYRPEQPVKFKFWVNQAKYDQDGKSPYAGQTFTVHVTNPKGEKIFEKQLAADVYGGFDGEFTLGKDATLGVYQIFLPQPENQLGGGGSFRLEEYKKPEFEVKVEAPAEPVMLGETITATITAKYYFGAPVTEATVKYKVTRTNHTANWYPVAYWDWFYAPGYWWFACDYDWYPGWREWGCRRPVPIWWQDWRPQQPPEIVAEAEVPVGKDGTVKVEIDSSVAKAMHPDTDHRYEITAEVRDQSRRTIVGSGQVLVARKPFKVYAWVDRGHYRTGDVIEASFKAQTLDNKPVQGKGELKLVKITYDKNGQPQEDTAEKWKLPTDAQGESRLQLKAAAPGQYRLSYTVTDSQGHHIEGGYVFSVMGEGLDSGKFRFNDIELVTDKKEYVPGDKVRLRVNTARANSTVLLFIRPANGAYQLPQLLRLQGKSAEASIEVQKKDMPNFFIEAVTVSNGQVFNEMREIIVPPEKRVLNVTVKPSKDSYKPGEKAEFTVKLTDTAGAPYSGSTVVAVYDKSVEYISGGSNVSDIKEFFWKWRRTHNMQGESSLAKGSPNLLKPGELGMGFVGVFGASLADELQAGLGGAKGKAMEGAAFGGSGGGGGAMRALKCAPMEMMDAAAAPCAAPMSAMAADKDATMASSANRMEQQATGPSATGPGADPGLAQTTVRSNFADTALWVATLQTDIKGEAKVELTMPENLTTWKTRVWAMGDGAKVGEGAAEVVTAKNLIIRLQAPRFFVQKDEVVLSANVHNYLKGRKQAKVVLELEGGTLAPLENLALPANGLWHLEQTVTVEPQGEKRVDFRVRVTTPGTAVVRMKALTDEESDAMQMSFPVYVHGMLKTDSFSGVIRPDKDSARVTVKVPSERLPEQSRLEVRYSPTLAAAMVDALPYLVDFPYGCTEQTLNRFLPTVITQNVLLRMGLDLKDIQKKQTNLNAQEIGDDKTRAADWKRVSPPNPGTAERNPVFDSEVVKDMVKTGIARLVSMQCSDGGWGWFSGWGEQSWPHTTAVVVHGFQVARDNDAVVPADVLARGIEWLKAYQTDQVRRLKLPDTAREHKHAADDLDTLVYMVLVDEKADHKEMREFLYRDRNGLAVYSKAMLGLACHKVGDLEKRDMLVRNIEQFLKQDDENQTAYLQLPESNCWWYWYGSEYEAHAYYLKLLALVEPKSEKASRLVKYLINNRKHATYWNSTRDTAVVIEAFADYIKASGEDQPDMTVQLLVDGKQVKEVKINKSNLFSFDNRLLLEGAAVTAGEHQVEFRKSGKGPLYFNAYLTNFTLEDPITRAGLEIKVNRKFYKLTEADKTIQVEGVRGQALNQKVAKFARTEIPNLGTLKSGDLVEVELELDSKNDYEYIVFEDMKAAGTEPVDLRSGYNGNEMGAYVEFRDERVVFFIRALARGKHSVSYRLRAEIPGKFSALPTRGSAMYAPELKANSDEWKLQIAD